MLATTLRTRARLNVCVLLAALGKHPQLNILARKFLSAQASAGWLLWGAGEGTFEYNEDGATPPRNRLQLVAFSPTNRCFAKFPAVLPHPRLDWAPVLEASWKFSDPSTLAPDSVSRCQLWNALEAELAAMLSGI